MDNDFVGLADSLERELVARAKRCGWKAAPNPALLLDADKDQATTELALPLAPATYELPRFRRALALSPATVTILVCGLDGAEASYRSALWWTSLVRTDLAPAYRSDLHLFLVAPRGANDDAGWRGRRSRIESDDRFCRKFLWLPSTEPNSTEIGTFLDRTFLATPWEGGSASPRSLDPLERLIDEFHSPNITREETQAWIERLEAFDGATAGIAEALVDVIRGEQ